VTHAYAIRDALIAGRQGVGGDAHAYGEVMLDDLKVHLSEPYPPPSDPGHDPHLRTGDLRHSYLVQTAEDAVGATIEFASRIKYAVYLEFGTRRMLPRPHLRPLALRHAQPLREVLGAGIERRERGSRL